MCRSYLPRQKLKKTKEFRTSLIFIDIILGSNYKSMSATHNTTDEEEAIVTCSELLEQIENEEEELDRERALYGNCDIDTCTYPQVHHIYSVF